MKQTSACRQKYFKVFSTIWKNQRKKRNSKAPRRQKAFFFAELESDQAFGFPFRLRAIVLLPLLPRVQLGEAVAFDRDGEGDAEDDDVAHDGDGDAAGGDDVVAYDSDDDDVTYDGDGEADDEDAKDGAETAE